MPVPPGRIPAFAWLLAAFFLTGVLSLPILLASLRWNWPMAYACPALLSFGWVAVQMRMARLHPQLFQRRAREGQPVAPGDRKLVAGIQFSICLMLALGGWQGRLQGPLPSVPMATAAFASLLLGFLLLRRCIDVNPHFEGLVRHQKESQHKVVTQGPYSWVRHPGYVGFLLVLASAPLLLCSSYAWIGWGLCALCFVLRCLLEDRWLTNHLPGYPEYRQQVRSRLIPGLW